MRNQPEWTHILSDNKSFFIGTLNCFNRAYVRYVTAFMLGTGQSVILSRLRFDEFSRACADDIYRYAIYHPLSQRHSIIESVRVSYMVKWLMHFRPIMLDSYSTLADQEKTLSYVGHDREKASEFFRRCNELFAVFLASYVLGVVEDVPESDAISPQMPSLITDLMDINQRGELDPNRREIRDFLYALRYRLNHQDIYRPIFRRIEAMARAPS